MRIDYADGLVFVCGERQRDVGTLVTTIGYNTDGKWLFLKDFEYEEDSDHAVHSLSIIDNTIYIHGVTNVSGNDKYFALKYQYHHKESYYIESDDALSRVGKELIIDFEPSVMNLNKIDHDHYMFSQIQNFISAAAMSSLSSKAGVDMSKQVASKVYPECHSWDTLSTSRLGNPVPIPKFWSTLLVELPASVNDSLVLDSILTSKYVRGAFFNEVGEFIDCTPNDEYFVAGDQAGLGATAMTPNAHINVLDAWCLAEGEQEIKVGILDSGIKYNHEDLHDFPGSESYEDSDVAGGYYVANFTLPPTAVEDLPVEGEGDTDFDYYFHGSLIAGIISARRDNNIGGAGISGKSNDADGVSLYDMTISTSHILSPGTIISRAFYVAATDEGQVNPNPDFPTDMNYSLGLDIINCSFRHGELFLKRAVEYCFRNEMVVVTASGNWTEGESFDIDDPLFPASYKDEWVLKVGANDNTGGRAGFSVYGHNMDFIAPGVNDIFRSFAPEDLSNNLGLHYYDDDDSEFYTPTDVLIDNQEFSGTSYAAPHVVGIAGLMKSYVDLHPQAPNELAGEDVEHIMQSNVSNDPHYFDTPPEVGYDNETGYGRPNAGRILEKLQLPCYKVRHFQGGAQANSIWTLDAQNIVVSISGSNVSAINQSLPAFGNYDADRYKITSTVSHDIDGENLLEAWKRDAASNLAPNTLELPGDGVSVSMDSYDANSATLTGYVYKIYDNSEIYWWPIDPNDNAVFAYSVYSHDTQAGPCATVSVKDEIAGNNFKVYPNPAKDLVFIEQLNSGKARLNVYNAQGSLVLNQRLTSSQNVLNVSHFSPGIYLFDLRGDNTRNSFKIIVK